MASSIDNVQTSNTFTSATTIQDQYLGAGGYGFVTTADVYAQIQSGDIYTSDWSDAFHIPVGAFQIPTEATGIRFWSYTAGTPGTVTAVIFARDDPQLSLNSTGQATNIFVTGVTLPEEQGSSSYPTGQIDWSYPGAVTPHEWLWGQYDTTILHHEIVIQSGSATDPSSVQGILLRDDGVSMFLNLSYTAAAQHIQGPLAISFATAPTGMSAGGGGHYGIYINNVDTGALNLITATSSNQAIGTSLSTDTGSEYRFFMDYNGNIQWGPGGAALDTGPFGRAAAGIIGGNTAAALTTGLLAASLTGAQHAGCLITNAGAYVVCQSSGTGICFATDVTTDSGGNYRFQITINGAHSWAAGGGASTDLVLQRESNSPTGTGTFLELTTGAGLGYGTGTGGNNSQTGTSATLNKPTGQITFTSQTTTAGGTVAYTITNSVVGVDDVIIVNVGTSTITGNQLVSVESVSAGSFIIVLWTASANTTKSVTFNFAVIKGASS